MPASPEKVTEKVTVKVPNDVGPEITIRRGGLDPITYPVTGDAVKVAAADVDHFLAHVEGSTLPGGNPSEPTP